MTKHHVLNFTGSFLLGLLALSCQAGFQVSGHQLLDANGNPVVMRGVNHPHAWFNHRTDSFRDIAETGSNTVRVVLSDGQQFAKTSALDMQLAISLCKANRLVCVLEIHDVTGSGQKAEAGTMEKAVDYWISMADVLKGEEDFVIINIANEPYGNNLPASAWIDGHIDAIKRLRQAGFTHTLMVDAANWGQDWVNVTLDNASTVAAADVLNNTMFSVHMYGIYKNRVKIENYVSTFLDRHNVPLIIGEFAAEHQGGEVDEDSILAVAEQYQVGYLGWSWSGNNAAANLPLNLVINFDASNLSSWGERLINGVNGIRETSTQASIYQNFTPDPIRMCNWSRTIFPLCEQLSSGWGEENGQLCIGVDTCAAQAENSGGPIIYPWPTPSPSVTPSASPSPTPTAAPSATPSALPTPVPSTSPLPTPSPTPIVTPTPSPTPSSVPLGVTCSHRVINAWNNGFQGAITISNGSGQSLDGWSLQWEYIDGQSSIAHSWSANVSGSGPYFASNLKWNSKIPAGQSVEFGFIGVGTGENAQLGGPSCTR